MRPFGVTMLPCPKCTRRMDPWRSLCLDCSRKIQAPCDPERFATTRRRSSTKALHPSHEDADMPEVYCVKAAEIAYKFGFSISSKNRLSGIQTGSPILLNLVGYVGGTRDLEALVLKYLAPSRIHGEWFKQDPKVIELAEAFSHKSQREVADLLGINIRSTYFIGGRNICSWREVFE